MINYIDIRKIPSILVNAVKTTIDYYKSRTNNSGYKTKYDFSVPDELLKDIKKFFCLKILKR